MKFNVIVKTSTSLTLELDNNTIVESDTTFDVFVDDECVLLDENRNVFSIYNLKPSQDYSVSIINNLNESFSKTIRTNKESVCLNVRRFNAKGDGVTDDTSSIQAAIMSCPKNGRVLIPAGDYSVKTIFLKSDITIEIAKDAVLSFTGQFFEGAILPGYIENSHGDEFYLGSWEGNPLDTYTALIQGIHVENVLIIGEGTLEGNGHNYWDYPKVKRGAWRPRLFQIINSKNVTLQGITIQNSPSWTIHPLFSNDLIFADLKIINPRDSPNTDGLDPESCNNILIVGVYFSVGDDCIAIKAGKIYLGRKLKRPTQNMIIRNCSMNFGHGAVVLGSEMAGGIKNLLVKQCLFNETDRGLRIKTRRGRGKDAIIDNIHFENIKMEKVLAPLVINNFYYCDPDGKSDYVKTKEKLPVDDRTPYIGKLVFENIQANNSETTAGFFYGLPEQPITELVLKNCHFNFAVDAQPGEPAMMDDIPKYLKAGLIFNNVEKVNLTNITLDNIEGEKITLNNVQEVLKNNVN